MKTGTKVRVIKEFSRGIFDFEVGDILTVANYIHKGDVYLKANGVTDLIRIGSSIMDDYIEKIEIVNAQKLKKIVTACLERVYNSDGMIESAKADAMRAIDKFEAKQDLLHSLNSLIRDYYVSKGYVVGQGKWEFLVNITSQYKMNRLSVCFYDEKLGGYVGEIFTGARCTTKEMFDEAMEFFKGGSGK